MHTISETDKDGPVTILPIAFDYPSAHVQQLNRKLDVAVLRFGVLAGGLTDWNNGKGQMSGTIPPSNNK